MSARAFRHRRFKRVIRLALETIPEDTMLGRAVVFAYWNAGFDPRSIETQMIAWRKAKMDSRLYARRNRRRKTSKQRRTAKRKWNRMSPTQRAVIGITSMGMMAMMLPMMRAFGGMR